MYTGQMKRRRTMGLSVVIGEIANGRDKPFWACSLRISVPSRVGYRSTLCFDFDGEGESLNGVDTPPNDDLLFFDLSFGLSIDLSIASSGELTVRSSCSSNSG